MTTGATSANPGLSTEEVLERTSAYFEEVLWSSEIGSSIRDWLSRWGVRDETLRAFGVGYAPGSSREILDHLARLDCGEPDLVAAGVASRSPRGGHQS